EQSLQRLAGRLGVGRLAWTQQRVDLLESQLFALLAGYPLLRLVLVDDPRCGILGKGVLDQRRFHAPRGREDANVRHTRLANLPREVCRERLVRIRQYFARLGLHYIYGDGARHLTLTVLE